jgi:hypothetical protein
MSRVKHEEDVKEDNWRNVCQGNNWLCQLCGAYPPRGNPCGYENGLCPQCRIGDGT